MTRVRSSVVGNCTSSICTAASLSSTARGVRPGANCMQSDVQAIGEEGNEDMGLNAPFELVVDWAQIQIVLHGFEGGLDLDELSVELPQVGGILPAKIGAQKITTLTPAHLTQLVTIEFEAERSAFGGHIDINETPCGASLAARVAELHEQFLAIDLHGRDLLEARP